MIGYWPDIEKSRAEARRLLKEAGQENLTFELLNRNVDQPYKIVGTWLVDEWSKVGIKATQKVVPTGPWLDAMRSGDFTVALEANCQNVVNPIADVGRWLPHEVQRENYGYFSDPEMIDIYNRMLKETDLDQGARADAPIRYAHQPAGASVDGDLLVPHRADAVLRERLEDLAEPLPEPGSGEYLAG